VRLPIWHVQARSRGRVSHVGRDGKIRAGPIRSVAEVNNPSDGAHPAYEWGYSASDAARRSFGIPDDDPDGSKIFFWKQDEAFGSVPDSGQQWGPHTDFARNLVELEGRHLRSCA
jgi:hypothetical protein